jgi:hypothetical protein
VDVVIIGTTSKEEESCCWSWLLSTLRDEELSEDKESCTSSAVVKNTGRRKRKRKRKEEGEWKWSGNMMGAN